MVSAENTVAVIIPVCDNEEFVRRALFSVLAQTKMPDEIIIVENSTSRSPEYYAFLSSLPRICRTIFAEPRIGPSNARNLGAKCASSTFLAFLDADDEWVEDKISAQLDFMASHHHVASSTGFFFVIEDQSIRKNSKSNQLGGLKDKQSVNHFALGSTLMIKRDSFNNLNGFQENLSRFEDWEFGIKSTINGYDIAFYPRALSKIHRLPNDNWRGAGIAISQLASIIKKYRSEGKLSTRFYFKIVSGIFYEKAVIHYREKRYLKTFLLLTISSIINLKVLRVIRFSKRLTNFYRNIFRNKST